ncbi:MAG: hypothetical protein AB1646_19465 [Thermodesulfobacteriota bacterium]
MELSAESLSTVGSVASIISLPLSLYAVFAVLTVRRALKARSLNTRMSQWFADLKLIPPGKTKLTSSQRKEIDSLLKHLEDFCLSRLPWCDREAKKLVRRLKRELLLDPHPKQTVRLLALLEEQLLTVTRL